MIARFPFGQLQSNCTSSERKRKLKNLAGCLPNLLIPQSLGGDKSGLQNCPGLFKILAGK